MLFNLLEQAAAVSENFGERAASGGFTFLLGMIVIFAGMTILVLCVTGFGKIAEAIAKKAKKRKNLPKNLLKRRTTAPFRKI